MAKISRKNINEANSFIKITSLVIFYILKNKEKGINIKMSLRNRIRRAKQKKNLLHYYLIPHMDMTSDWMRDLTVKFLY